MTAGRDMDLEIAVRVMGWRGDVLWIDDEEGRDPYLFPPDAKPEHVATNDRDWDCRVPCYSTETDEALDVWLAMQRSSNARKMIVNPKLPPALGICRAALRALLPPA